jgi:hypothetical protein
MIVSVADDWCRVSAPDDVDVNELRKVEVPGGLDIEILEFFE